MHTLLRELWERHRPSVLLVTHDVDEAIVLADRVLVLDEGRIGLDLTIDRPHPRSYRDPLLGEYRERLLTALGVTEHHDHHETDGTDGSHGTHGTGRADDHQKRHEHHEHAEDPK